MTDYVKCAVTQPEWYARTFATREIVGEGSVTLEADGDVFVKADDGEGAFFHGRDAHALAAFCLWDQAFGFSHDDEMLLWSLYQSSEEGAAITLTEGQRDGLMSIAARIEALLPMVEASAPSVGPSEDTR